MRRAIEFCQRAVKRVNARLAILIVVVLAGGIAVWQGFSHMARNKPEAKAKGPTKQVATGTPAGLAAAIQPATATLSDDELPGGGGGHSTMGYSDDPSARPPTAPPSSTPPTQPQTNPYLPNSGDPPGGYAATDASRRQLAYGDSPYSAADNAQPSTTYGVSDAAGASSNGVPSNPYRAAVGVTDDVSTEQLSPAAGDSASAYGYADPSHTNPAATVETTTAAPAAPAAAPTDNPYAVSDATAMDGTTAPPPANALPAASLNESPYAAAARSNAALDSPAGGSTVSSGGYGARPAPPASFGSPSVAGTAPSAGSLAAATPGGRQLEGPQQPVVLIEKHAPQEIQVGKPATFTTIVRNSGPSAAQQVVVTDHVPSGTQLVAVRPQPQQTAGGALVWDLGTLQPGEEVQIAVEVMPETEGEIGSTAHVSVAATATSRSICTRPLLAIEHSAPPKVLIGEPLPVAITVSNSGTGAATGVTIEEDVPDGLSHLAGGQLEYEVGTLRPGESKRLDLALKAEKPGIVQNTIVVHGEGGLTAQHTVQVEVVAPQLEVDIEGPKVRFLERQATYTIEIANPGTAAAREVELIAFLPGGMKFVEADSQGQYDASRHAVFWSLAELPAAKKGPVKLTALPVEPGEQKLRVEGRASLGLAAAGEQIVHVEQSAELLHTVKDLDEVIEVGSETTYEIRVTNSGTKAATNVRVAATLPAGMLAIRGEGPTRVTPESDGAQVVFEPLARLNPQEEVLFKVLVQGQQPGDHIIRVALSSEEWKTPVTREESTRVYQDR